MNKINRVQIWKQWVLANAIAEAVGLGLTFAAGFGLFVFLGDPTTIRESLTFGGLMVATGLIEGSTVGFLQWRVLSKLLPGVTLRAWLVATLIGVLTAWLLGSIPSTVANIQTNPEANPVEPGLFVILSLAAGMGVILGIVLALPQWLVLRKRTARAWYWLPANSMAWLAGLPIIFFAVDLAFKTQPVLLAMTLFASALAITGAVVGAIHGLVLIRFEPKSSP